MTEEFRPVVGWEAAYEISAEGVVRSLPRETRNATATWISKPKIRSVHRGAVTLSFEGRRHRYTVWRLLEMSWPEVTEYAGIRQADRRTPCQSDEERAIRRSRSFAKSYKKRRAELGKVPGEPRAKAAPKPKAPKPPKASQKRRGRPPTKPVAAPVAMRFEGEISTEKDWTQFKIAVDPARVREMAARQISPAVIASVLKISVADVEAMTAA